MCFIRTTCVKVGFRVKNVFWTVRHLYMHRYVSDSVPSEHICDTKQAQRESGADWRWMVISAADGPCVSFPDLITREKNRVRGGAWSRDKKREVVSVQISSERTKRDMARERPGEKEDKLLRLDKGQNCLSAPVMAYTNRPLLISLYLLRLPPFLSCCLFSFYSSVCLLAPFFSLLTHYLSSFLSSFPLLSV